MDNVPSCLILKLSEFQVSSLADPSSLDTILRIEWSFGGYVKKNRNHLGSLTKGGGI